MKKPLRHCVVALNTTGEFIQYIDLGWPSTKKAYRQRQIWTLDHSHAMEVCGAYSELLANSPRPLWLHPNNRRNVPSKMVGGYEVVSEEQP